MQIAQLLTQPTTVATLFISLFRALWQPKRWRHNLKVLCNVAFWPRLKNRRSQKCNAAHQFNSVILCYCAVFHLNLCPLHRMIGLVSFGKVFKQRFLEDTPKSTEMTLEHCISCTCLGWSAISLIWDHFTLSQIIFHLDHITHLLLNCLQNNLFCHIHLWGDFLKGQVFNLNGFII